jgi:hypothetical protein
MPGATDCTNVPNFSAFEGQSICVGLEVMRGGGMPTEVYRPQTTPHFRDWSTIPGGVIQLADCNIVPCATYAIDAIADTDYPGRSAGRLIHAAFSEHDAGLWRPQVSLDERTPRRHRRCL